MAHSLFRAADHASIYAQFRPLAPTSLIERIIGVVKNKCEHPLNLAIDVGCGNGQTTNLIAPFFRRVIGTDVSEAQIAEAVKSSKLDSVSYMVSEAADIPAEPSSVQLITASQAAHWFNLPKFYAEVDKKLVPTGFLAIFGYTFPQIVVERKEMALFEAVNHVYEVETKGFWDPGRLGVDSEYRDIIIPYEERVRENHYLNLTWTLARFSNYLTTWSGYQAMIKERGENRGKEVIQEFENKVKSILGTADDSASIQLPVQVKFFLLMGRKPKS